MSEPLRVVQWTTGNIGRRSLHAIIGRPDLELVGVYAHGEEKVGRDAAELCGRPEPTGRAGHARRRRADRAASGRLLLQPVVAEHRASWCGCSRPASTSAPVPHGSRAASRAPRTAPGSRRRASRGAARSSAAAPTPASPTWSGWRSRVPARSWTRSRSPSRWTARRTSPPAPRPRWGSRSHRTHQGWPRAYAGRARCSPSRPR